jgi:hypothetical protein
MEPWRRQGHRPLAAGGRAPAAPGAAADTAAAALLPWLWRAHAVPMPCPPLPHSQHAQPQRLQQGVPVAGPPPTHAQQAKRLEQAHLKQAEAQAQAQVERA